MRRLQHNAAAGAVAVDSLQLVTAELAEEVGARQVHRAVAVFRRHFALGLLAHAQNRVEQKRERREARDEQHSASARLRLARRRTSVDQAHARACFSLQSLQSPCRLCSSSLLYCTYFARATASVIFSAACAPAFFRGAKSGRRKLLVPRRPVRRRAQVLRRPRSRSHLPDRQQVRSGHLAELELRASTRSSSSLARALGEHGLGHGPHVAADCAPAQWCSDVDGVCWARGRSGGVRRHLGRDRLPEPGL